MVVTAYLQDLIAWLHGTRDVLPGLWPQQAGKGEEGCHGDGETEDEEHESVTIELSGRYLSHFTPVHPEKPAL